MPDPAAPIDVDPDPVDAPRTRWYVIIRSDTDGPRADACSVGIVAATSHGRAVATLQRQLGGVPITYDAPDLAPGEEPRGYDTEAEAIDSVRGETPAEDFAAMPGVIVHEDRVDPREPEGPRGVR